MGTLDAFLKRYSRKITFIKPYGALYRMVEDDEDLAEALVEAVLEFNPELAIISEENTKLSAITKKRGVRLIREVFTDLEYDDNGKIIIERNKKEVDPELALKRALLAVTKGQIITKSGKIKNVKPDTLCIHGDSPNAVEVARTVRNGLINNKKRVMSFIADIL